LTKEQFRDNTVHAAQIGAAEAGNGLYTVEVNPQGTGPICTVRLRFRDPATGEVSEHAWDVPYEGPALALDQASPAMRLAATASAFSEWLAQSPYAGDVSTDELLNDLRGVPAVFGADTRPQQLEAMIREAKSLTGK
jgi:Ca-activated chloride channel family protein